MMRCVRCATLSLIAMAFAAGDVSGQTPPPTFQWFNQAADGAAKNDWHHQFGGNWAENGVQATRAPADGSDVFVNGAPNPDLNFATVNQNANQGGSFRRLFIGQGGGPGAVHLETGGSISTDSLDIGRNGQLGRLRVQGGQFTTNSWQPTDLAPPGTAEIEISSGSMTVNGYVRNIGNASATWNLSGGSLTAERFSLDPSTELHIGGDASFTTTSGRFDFDAGSQTGGVLTIDGSLATIDITRASNPAFRAEPNAVINFIADADGFSAINLNGGGLQIGDDGLNDTTLNVDATALGAGIYDLFVHSGGDLWNGLAPGITSDPNSFGFAFENLILADSLTGSILYNPDSIQLSVVPEPGSCALLATAGCISLLRRRRIGRALRR